MYRPITLSFAVAMLLAVAALGLSQNTSNRGAAAAGSNEALRRMQEQADWLKDQKDQIDKKNAAKAEKEKRVADAKNQRAKTSPKTRPGASAVTTLNKEAKAVTGRDLPASAGAAAYDDYIEPVAGLLRAAYLQELRTLKESIVKDEDRLVTSMNLRERQTLAATVRETRAKVDKLERNDPPYINLEVLKKRR